MYKLVLITAGTVDTGYWKTAIVATDAGGMVELGLTASFNMNWTGWKIFNTIASFVDY